MAGHASRAQCVTTWKVTISYSLKTPIRYDTLPLGTWAPGQCWAAAAGGARGAALGRRETVRKAAAGPRPIFFQRLKHLEGRSCPGTVRRRWGWQPGWTTLQLGKVARLECQHTLVQVNTCRAMPIPLLLVHMNIFKNWIVSVALATFMPLLRVFLRVEHVYVHVFSITFLRFFHFLTMKTNIVHSVVHTLLLTCK